MSTNASLPVKPSDFEQRSAADKADWVWNTLIGETRHHPIARPDLARSKAWTMFGVAGRRSTLARTLDRVDDLMEANRPKIIHTHGAVAMIDFETVADSPFTGVLASPANGGGAQGLVRMSLAVPPERKAAVTPGMGLKLFVDGAPSLDLLAMNHTVGQGRDFNLFSNTFTHDLREEHTELRLPQKLMQVFFKRVTSQPRQLMIDHFAAVDRTGAACDDPIVPHRLLFRPHGDVRRLFRNKHGEDFRETLERIAENTTMYDVEAVAPLSPDGTRPPNRKLGIVRTTTAFASSDGGDRLFFRHVVDPATRVDG